MINFHAVYTQSAVIDSAVRPHKLNCYRSSSTFIFWSGRQVFIIYYLLLTLHGYCNNNIAIVWVHSSDHDLGTTTIQQVCTHHQPFLVLHSMAFPSGRLATHKLSLATDLPTSLLLFGRVCGIVNLRM